MFEIATGSIRPIRIPSQLQDGEIFEGTTATAIRFKAKSSRIGGRGELA